MENNTIAKVKVLTILLCVALAIVPLYIVWIVWSYHFLTKLGLSLAVYFALQALRPFIEKYLSRFFK